MPIQASPHTCLLGCSRGRHHRRVCEAAGRWAASGEARETTTAVLASAVYDDRSSVSMRLGSAGPGVVDAVPVCEKGPASFKFEQGVVCQLASTATAPGPGREPSAGCIYCVQQLDVGRGRGRSRGRSAPFSI